MFYLFYHVQLLLYITFIVLENHRVSIYCEIALFMLSLSYS